MPSPSPAAAGPPGVRPPLQRRSRKSWSRVLDVGVALLEEGGYEAFTIAAVCDRAQVAPPALYARVDSKEALFLAVYEHGMARVQADQAVLADGERWRGLAPEDVALQALREVAGIFRRHAAFLRSVILISGVNAEVFRRGAQYSGQLGDQFAHLLLRTRDGIDDPDPETAVRETFSIAFSALVLRVAYGPAFAPSSADDETFLRSLGTMVCRYLFGSSTPERVARGPAGGDELDLGEVVGPGRGAEAAPSAVP